MDGLLGWRIAIWIAVFIAGPACDLVAPFSPTAQRDLGSTADLPDAAVNDGPACVEPVEPCPEPDTDTVALFRFDNDLAAEGDAPAGEPLVDEPSGSPLFYAFRAKCDASLQFAGNPAGSVVEIPHDDLFALEAGSVDLWVRFEPLNLGPDDLRIEGILSRDARAQQNAGHLTLFRLLEGSNHLVVARYQAQSSTSEPETSYHLCAELPQSGPWHHLGINFGDRKPFEFWVDGRQPERPSGRFTWSREPLWTFECLDPLEDTLPLEGIAGNSNPWVVGAPRVNADEGVAGTAGFSGVLNGQIDHLRISKERRNFSDYACLF